jgi:hypothetical protein
LKNSQRAWTLLGTPTSIGLIFADYRSVVNDLDQGSDDYFIVDVSEVCFGSLNLGKELSGNLH